ncbi:MAG: low molecular weight protein-tyrosine-phosphatase [Anaerolineae bacterium]
MIKVLMVCTGNICRSPMAEFVLRDMVQRAGLAGQIQVDSAGISDEEVGNAVSRGTVDMMKQHKIPHDARRPARHITADDLSSFDYLLAMDHNHMRYMERRAVNGSGMMEMFLSDAAKKGTVTREDVPDPWYDGQYARTYDLVTKGCAAFLERLRAEHQI